MAFEVAVREGGAESRHRVTMTAETWARLAGGATPERCVEAAFRFLLDRESVDAILSRFDIAVIPRYFPELEQELPRYLAQSRAGAEQGGVMLGSIAGDIVGSRFEGHRAPPPGFALFHPDSHFTDDSVCTIAVADALLGGRDFAASLRAFVRRHPRRGYGGMFLEWALTDDAPAYGSWGNGAPMRVAAVGWLARDQTEALELAAAQAAVSHDHPDAVAAARAVALAILLARRGLPAEALRRRLEDAFGYDLARERVLAGGGFDVSAAGTVPPALAAALEAADWEEAVRTVVCMGGDTDTLACIAGGLAEALHGLPADIARAARDHLTEDLREVLERFEAAEWPA